MFFFGGGALPAGAGHPDEHQLSGETAASHADLILPVHRNKDPRGGHAIIMRCQRHVDVVIIIKYYYFMPQRCYYAEPVPYWTNTLQYSRPMAFGRPRPGPLETLMRRQSNTHHPHRVSIDTDCLATFCCSSVPQPHQELQRPSLVPYCVRTQSQCLSKVGSFIGDSETIRVDSSCGGVETVASALCGQIAAQGAH